MEKADILIHGCAILPMNKRTVVKDGAIALQDGKIIFVGKHSRANKIHAETRIDATGKAAFPGLINCHTHVPMTLFRGIAEDQPLNTWLKDIIWPLEAKLKTEDIRVGALLGCLEMIKNGTTCFSDMYFHEEEIARAVEESGLRGVLSEGIIEAGDKALGEKMLNESVNLARSFNGYANDRVTTLLGPHSAYSCSPELLTKVTEKASELNVGVHIHLAESKEMFREFHQQYGFSEVEYLDKIGFLKGHVLAAHCINLTEEDMHVLFRSGVNVAYVPVANMKLGLGAAKIKKLVDLGLNVGLGTDGPASNNSLDLFETMKMAALLQKLTYLDPKVLPVYEVLEMATINGARVIGLERDIGSLEVGKKADVVLVGLSKPHLKPLHNIHANIVYSGRGSDVDTVIVDGKIIMENRQVKTLNEQAVMERAEKIAWNLLSHKS